MILNVTFGTKCENVLFTQCFYHHHHFKNNVAGSSIVHGQGKQNKLIGDNALCYKISAACLIANCHDGIMPSLASVPFGVMAAQFHI